MANTKTSIAWTDATWSPIRGCSKVSSGCANCYAESVAHRFNAPGLPYEGLTKDGRWNGTVRLVPEHLADPLRWQRPRKIFVNSMSDLFHESLNAKTIAAVFGIMAAASRHTFQVLTKRPERMRAFLNGEERDRGASVRETCFYAARDAVGEKMLRDCDPWDVDFPLPNVWLGVSVEDQATADKRIPILLDTPAAVRFVSYEPALGPVDFGKFTLCACLGTGCAECQGDPERSPLHWIIVGGESGSSARPFDVGWARSTVKQCAAAHVACFVKQMGSVPVLFGGTNARHSWPDGTEFDEPDENTRQTIALHNSHGADEAEWPESLRVQEFPR